MAGLVPAIYDPQPPWGRPTKAARGSSGSSHELGALRPLADRVCALADQLTVNRAVLQIQPRLLRTLKSAELRSLIFAESMPEEPPATYSPQAWPSAKAQKLFGEALAQIGRETSDSRLQHLGSLHQKKAGKAADALDSEADAQSLRMQEQIEAEARKIAWQRTCENSRSAKPAAKSEPSEAQPLWRSFTPVPFNLTEEIQGVYAIVDPTTGRCYVGSSIDLPRRLREHRGALRDERHHAVKLQSAWLGGSADHFRYLLIERVAGSIKALRKREQHWIRELHAYPEGFNSKSTADGPQADLYTVIDVAIKERLPQLYRRLAPEKPTYTPSAADLSAYDRELKAHKKATNLIKLKKLGYAATAFVLGSTALDKHALVFLWVGVLWCILRIFAEKPNPPPDTPGQRADARAEADFQRAIAVASRWADGLLIVQLAREMGVPEHEVAAAYKDAPGVVRRRRESREKFLRKRRRW
jgi:GIY-YIG catalytic domain